MARLAFVVGGLCLAFGAVGSTVSHSMFTDRVFGDRVAASLDNPMPMRDAQTSALCQQQCQLLLARMSKSSGFVDRVRQLIVARPGYFPDIDLVAEKLHMTSRTLRRRLTEEGSSFQQILAEVRYQLAREYLGTSNLPIEEISVLLGYSSPGNFTNAFKRWHGSSPRAYRKEAH